MAIRLTTYDDFLDALPFLWFAGKYTIDKQETISFAGSPKVQLSPFNAIKVVSFTNSAITLTYRSAYTSLDCSLLKHKETGAYLVAYLGKLNTTLRDKLFEKFQLVKELLIQKELLDYTLLALQNYSVINVLATMRFLYDIERTQFASVSLRTYSEGVGRVVVELNKFSTPKAQFVFARSLYQVYKDRHKYIQKAFDGELAYFVQMSSQCEIRIVGADRQRLYSHVLKGFNEAKIKQLQETRIGKSYLLFLHASDYILCTTETLEKAKCIYSL